MTIAKIVAATIDPASEYASVDWVDTRGKSGSTQGALSSTHMQSLLKRAEREIPGWGATYRRLMGEETSTDEARERFMKQRDKLLAKRFPEFPVPTRFTSSRSAGPRSTPSLPPGTRRG